MDKGDPAAGGLATDFLAAPRPDDGDGDGVAVRDQGAFEYQRPAPPSGGGETPGGGAGGGSGGGGANASSPDITAPVTRLLAGPGKGVGEGRARFRFGSSEAGSHYQCKLDARKVRPCASPQAYAGLRPGRHSFRVWAIDAAGNRDATPAKRRFGVPG